MFLDANTWDPDLKSLGFLKPTTIGQRRISNEKTHPCHFGWVSAHGTFPILAGKRGLNICLRMVHDPSLIYHRGVYHVKMYRCCECSGGIVGFSWLSAWLLQTLQADSVEAAAQPHSSLQQKAAKWRCHSWWPGRHPQESIGENDFPC